MNSNERMKENLKNLIKILIDTDHPMTIRELRQQASLKQINSDVTVYAYFKKLPDYLEENQEIVKTHLGHRVGYQIIDKSDKYPTIKKTEEGYNDPTAAMAMKSIQKEQLPSELKYFPGDIWLIKAANGNEEPWLVLSTSPLKVITCRAYDQSDANNGYFKPETPGIVKVGDNLWADTAMLCTKKTKWFTTNRVASITMDRLKVVKNRIAENLDIIPDKSVLEAAVNQLKDSVDRRNARIKELEKQQRGRDATIARLRNEITELKRVEAAPISYSTVSNLTADNEKAHLENLYLKGKVEAYEMIFDKLRPETTLQATTRATEDLLARRILQEIAGLKTDDMWELSRAIIFGNNTEGDKNGETSGLDTGERPDIRSTAGVDEST